MNPTEAFDAKRIAFLFLALLMLPVLYVLSIGPAVRLKRDKVRLKQPSFYGSRYDHYAIWKNLSEEY